MLIIIIASALRAAPDAELRGVTVRVACGARGESGGVLDLLLGGVEAPSILFLARAGGLERAADLLSEASRLLTERGRVVVVDSACALGGAGGGAPPAKGTGLARVLTPASAGGQAALIEAVALEHAPAVLVAASVRTRA